MIVINFLGGPGSGKSTGAAYVFSRLKLMGVNCELITEYAKDLVWENNDIALSNQIHVFGEQYQRMYRCLEKVDVLLTDSPLILSSIYSKDKNIYNEDFDRFVLNVFNSFNNLNFFVTRVKPYVQSGRIENEHESSIVSKIILDFLCKNDISYIDVKGDISGYNKITDMVLEKVKYKGK